MNKKTKGIIKDIIFGAFWIYLFVKIFFFDVERYIFHRLHISQEWLLDYRFIVFLFFLSLLWVTIGNKRFWLNFLHLLAYPLIWIFWRLPVFFFWRIPKHYYLKGQHISLFAYANFLLNSLWEIKYIILKSTSLMIAVLIIIYSSNYYFLGASALVLTIILIFHLKKRYSQAYAPVKIFRVGVEFLNIEESKKMFLPEIITKDIESDKNKDEQEKKMSNIEGLVLASTLLSFIGQKLKEFLNRRTYMKFFTQKIVITIFYAIFLLTLINIAVYKANPLNFTVSPNTGIFDFINYTIYSIMPDGTDIIPATTLTKAIRLFSTFTGIFILVILISVFFSISGEKYKEDITEVVKFSEFQVGEIQNYMIEKYAMPIHEAISELQKIKSSMINIVIELNKIKNR